LPRRISGGGAHSSGKPRRGLQKASSCIEHLYNSLPIRSERREALQRGTARSWSDGPARRPARGRAAGPRGISRSSPSLGEAAHPSWATRFRIPDCRQCDADRVRRSGDLHDGVHGIRLAGRTSPARDSNGTVGHISAECVSLHFQREIQIILTDFRFSGLLVYGKQGQAACRRRAETGASEENQFVFWRHTCLMLVSMP
jgi:hypothetical protein